MPNEMGRGAQVVLTGTAQGAARGVMGGMEQNAAVKRAMDDAGPDANGVEGETQGGASVALLPYAANDAAAAGLNVPVGGLYRNTAGVQQRQA